MTVMNEMISDIKLMTCEDMTLRESVYFTLRKAILHNRIREGEHLAEQQLAVLLGVSRTPVRDALRKLEKEGLVDLLPNRGAVVSPVRDADVAEALEIWFALEAYCISLICSGAEGGKGWNPAETRRLASPGMAGPEEDEAFHRSIIQAASNARILAVSEETWEILRRRRMTFFFGEDGPETVRREMIPERKRLFEALAQKKKEEAFSALRRIIDMYK